MGIEREAKLAVNAGFELPTFPDAVDRGIKVLDATYYDTNGFALAAEGVTLRHRNGVWTLKFPSSSSAGAVARDEIEVEGPADAIPPSLLSRLEAGPLVPVARLRSTRRKLQFDDVAEVVDDTVEVLDGDALVATFREVEVELLGDGEEADLERIVARLHAAGAGVHDPTPKVIRALRMMGRYGSP